MSAKLCVQFEVRDMLIMRDTLKQLGHNFTEVSQERLEIQRSYNPIVIQDGSISFDSANQSEVNQIKQTYMVNYYKDQAIREGMQVKEEVNDNGEIVLNIIR